MESISRIKEGVLLEGTTSFPIYYEDTDLSGFVYHANYIKFFDRAREHLLGIERLRNFRKKNGLDFAVAHAEINFLKPAQHGDILVIKSKCNICRSPVIEFDQRAYLNNVEAVTATIKLAAVNSSFSPIRIPQEFLEDLG
jgi:acyl-CoA thioester hydrolase